MALDNDDAKLKPGQQGRGEQCEYVDGMEYHSFPKGAVLHESIIWSEHNGLVQYGTFWGGDLA